MSEGSTSPKRARLEFDDGLKEDHFDKYKSRDHDDQGSYTHSRRKRGEPAEDDDLKESDDMKAKNVAIDVARREHTLVMRLTNKEQELQECMNQIQEMKQAQTQNTAQLRSMLLDPAINLVFQRMAREMDEHKEKLKQKQNELSAWKFTPDSQTGMRLMAKCRMLLQENGELGKMISSGRTSRLEGEITLQKALVTEMKQNQKELDEFVGELEEDVESMQGMILMLQQQLKEAREQITRLQDENQLLTMSQISVEPGGLTPDVQKEPSSHATPVPQPDVQTSWSTPQPDVQTSWPMPQPTHQLSPSSSSSKDFKETSLHKNSGNDNLVDASTSGLLNDFRLTGSHTSLDTQSPPDFKVTPDSGMHTQEEDDASVDATDFPSAGDLLIQDSNSLVKPDQDPITAKSELTAPSPSHLSPLAEERTSVHASHSLEVEHNSHEISSSIEVSNTHPSNEIARTSPFEDSVTLRTDSPVNSVSDDICSGSVSLSDRTSGTSIPTNGDELTVEVDAGSDRDLNRTSSSGDNEMGAENNVDNDKREEVSKQCGELDAAPLAVAKVEGQCTVECGFQLGLTNGSNDNFDGPDL